MADSGLYDIVPTSLGRADPSKSQLAPVQHSVDMLDFQPALLQLQQRPPSPLPRRVLLTLLALLGCLAAWACWGRLDIVAQAHGKLVPRSHVKIVQPSEQGVVRDILVHEGDVVDADQVLMRMDASLLEADWRAVRAELHYTELSLRRVDAELADAPFSQQPGDAEEVYAKIYEQYLANRNAHSGTLAVQQKALERAESQVAAAVDTQSKLNRLLAFSRDEESSMRRLEELGFATRLAALDQMRNRVEIEQDRAIQQRNIASAMAGRDEFRQRAVQVDSEYRRRLNAERVELSAREARLSEELAKLDLRRNSLELRAPQRGVVKDLATHTPGTVVSPGTILMTLVPLDDQLRAEVWVGNEDVGFVVPGQPVRLKLAPYQFQKYGMLDGEVLLVSADAAEEQSSASASGSDQNPTTLAYRTLVTLSKPYLPAGERELELFAGMRVTADIHLGERSVLEFVLSPVRRTLHDAARER